MMIRESIELAKQNGKKSVRLDALASHTPAHKIYEALGSNNIFMPKIRVGQIFSSLN